METIRIKIEGMHSDGCVSQVKSLLEKEHGVREGEVSCPAGEARVKYNEHTVGADRLRQVILQTETSNRLERGGTVFEIVSEGAPISPFHLLALPFGG